MDDNNVYYQKDGYRRCRTCRRDRDREWKAQSRAAAKEAIK